MKGYQAQISGKEDFKGFMFKNFIDKKQACIWINQTLKDCGTALHNGKSFTRIVELKLKYCDVGYCNELVERDMDVCLKCEDLMYDAQVEASEQKKQLLEDQDGV